ncbi:ABC transporter permease [Neorhizobium petrolearium]|uniref:ABC transporter permease n=1 Tax=Neorhizobium petrolearium TaxID=515361 RepID=UPI003F1689E3
MSTAMDFSAHGRMPLEAGSRLGNALRGVLDYGAIGTLLILMTLFVGLPVAFVIISAVLNDPLDVTSGLTFAAVRSVYTSAEIWHAAWQTIAMSVLVAVASTALGGLLAWVVTRLRLPAAGFLEMLIVIPLFLSPLVGAIAWVALAAPRSGILNDLLAMMNAPEWMRFDVMSLTGIAFVMIFHYVPYGFLFLSSALRNTDANLEEASYMCGGSVPSTALRIVLPLLRSSSLSSILFISILASGEFSVPAVLGAQGAYEPLAVHLYEAIYGFPQDFSRATAIGTMMIIVSLTAFYFYRRSVRSASRFVTVTGRGFATRRINPGRWKFPILAVFGIYTFISVILPYLALLFICFTRFRTGDLATTEFTLYNVMTVIAQPDVRSAIFNTIELAMIVPAICVVIGLLLVYLHERLKLPGAGLATYIATAPIAISGIVFATGVFVIYIRTPLYGTVWLIAVALVAHYLAHTVRITSNGLKQIDVALEEAAQINGASRLQVLFSILAPLIRPSVFSAFILIYVFTVREVNTSILLYSPSSLLLSVLSWNYQADGSLAQAAVVGMVQTVLMILGIILARLVLGVSTTKSTM